MKSLSNLANSYPAPANASYTMGGGSKTDSINGFDIVSSQIVLEVLSYLGEKERENFNLLNKRLHGGVQKYSHIKKQPFIQNTEKLIDAINATSYCDRSVHFKALLNKISSQKEGFLFSESANTFLEIKLQMLCIKRFSAEERAGIKSIITDNSSFYSFLESSDEDILKRAFYLSSRITNKEYRALALTPCIEKSLEIAGGITDDWDKAGAIEALAPRLTTPEQIDRALEIAGGVTDDWKKSGAIEALAPRLTTPEQIDRALEIAGEITDDWNKARAIEALAPKLTTPEQIDRAFEIVSGMTDDWNKAGALNALAPRLTTPEQVDRALEIAGEITDNWKKAYALKALASQLKTSVQMYKLLSMSPLSICNLVSCKILTITSVGFCGALAAMTPFINAYYSGD